MQNLENRLRNFLESNSSGVVALKGEWGIGKTHFVNEFLKSPGSGLEEKSYISVVSLFGISSIEQLRETLAPNMRTIRDLRTGTSVATRLRTFAHMARKLPYLDKLEAVFKKVDQAVVADIVVVLDDIERKDPKLSMGGVLGFVNYISEHMHCKVILILNDGQLAPTDVVDLDKLREKVIDLELIFSASYEQNVRLFFRDSNSVDCVLPIFRACRCRNLRIIRLCRDNFEHLCQRLGSIDSRSRFQLLRQSVMLTCLYYSTDKIRIDMNAALKWYSNPNLRAEECLLLPEAVEYLRSIDFQSTDFDTAILDLLKHGDVSEPVRLEVLGNMNRRVGQIALRSELENVYVLLTANFTTTKVEFTTKLKAFLDKNSSLLSWHDLQQAMSRLRRSGESFDEKIWINHWVTANVSSFTLQQCMEFSQANLGEQEMELIFAKIKYYLNGLSLREVVYSISDRGTWEIGDILYLEAITALNFEDWLESEKDSNLLLHLRNFCRHFRPDSDDASCRAIGLNLYSALAAIARKDLFNRQKILEFVGVKVSELSESCHLASLASEEGAANLQ